MPSLSTRLLKAGAFIAAFSFASILGFQSRADATATPRAHKTYVIGLIAKSQSNPVFQAARTGANDAAKELGKKYGVDIQIDWRTPVSEDAQKQADAMEQLAAGAADGIAISCSDANTLRAAIDSTVEKGIPVVCFDSDCPDSKRFAYYGTDDAACGKQIADELAKAMGERGVVAILAGNQTAPNLQRRVKGVKDELAKFPNISVKDTYYHKETPQDAVAKLEEVQRTNPEITGWAMVGGWPLFTEHALDNIAGKAKVVAVDALPAQIPYVKNGQVEVLLAQKVYDWGYESVRLIMQKLIDNKTPANPIIKADLVPVTRANADEFAKNWDKWLGK